MNKLNLKISWHEMGIIIHDVYDQDKKNYTAIKLYSVFLIFSMIHSAMFFLIN